MTYPADYDDYNNYDNSLSVSGTLNLLNQLQSLFKQKPDSHKLGPVESVVVTTSQDLAEQIERGRELARDIDCEFVLRNDRPLKNLFMNTLVQGIVVVESDRITLQSVEGPKSFFHPNMAKHRAEVLSRNGEDSMVTAMGLTPGQKVLDCTFGLGSDALIASLIVGKTGLVVGLEASLLLSAMIRWGMQEYPWQRVARVGELLRKASQQIKLFNLDHRKVLPQLPDASFDVVYFDPMFQQSVRCSNGIELIRSWGCHQPLEVVTIQQAARVARRRVVVKARKGSPEFTKIGFDRLIQGARRISYGIIDVDDALETR